VGFGEPMSKKQTEYEGDVVVEEVVTTEKPRPYNVVLHNDDFTTMEFVVMILERVFNHSQVSAVQLMQEVHHKGKSVVGTYPYEIAETKAAETMVLAQKSGYPLKCTVQPA
jgi:ATP-dependent Clp protease adaptor protein ClpS